MCRNFQSRIVCVFSPERIAGRNFFLNSNIRGVPNSEERAHTPQLRKEASTLENQRIPYVTPRPYALASRRSNLIIRDTHWRVERKHSVTLICGCSSVGRAQRCQRCCRRF